MLYFGSFDRLENLIVIKNENGYNGSIMGVKFGR